MQKEKINSVGIIGGGKMGKSIFSHVVKFPLKTVWINIIDAEKEKNKYLKKLSRLVEHEIISKNEFNNQCQRITISSDIQEVKGCDLIIEAVTEDVGIKNSLFNEIYPFLDKSAIICSNSSSFTPDSFSINKKQVKNFAGLHFFFPVETNKLVEIIPSSLTKKKTINVLKSFAISIEKKPLLQYGKNAFAVNRFFLEIQSELFNYCVSNDISFDVAEEIIKEHFFSTGIFSVMDYIGFEILIQAISNYIKLHRNPLQIEPILDFIINKSKKGETGYSAKNGFLKYPLNNISINTAVKEEIIRHTQYLFNKFAEEYIADNIFTKKELLSVIVEFTDSQYDPFSHKLNYGE